MATTYEVGSYEWWRDRLVGKLVELRSPLITLDDYYTGEHPLVYSSEKFRTAFGGLFHGLSDNWCGVVVDAVEERLRPQGIRIVGENDSQVLDDETGIRTLPKGVEADHDAWVMWQRNQLDSGVQMAHTEALVEGYANLLVWADRDGKALITPEAAQQSYVDCYAGTRTRAGAVKMWRDDWTGLLCCTIYLPDAIYKWQSKRPYRESETFTKVNWIPRTVMMDPDSEDSNEPWPLPNPLGVVPMVPLHNKPRLLDKADSEIRGTIPIQDAVNKLVADMLVASEYQAFRQRWATGLEIPVNPETNQPIEPFKAAVDRLWISEGEETKFGEFSQADLRVFVSGIEMFIQHAATQSRTPPHYFYLSGEFPSGESIKSAETGLVAKALRRMVHFGEAHEEAIRLGFAVEDDPRADAFMSELIWADPESRSEAEHTDAIVKMAKLGVPNEALWERWGATPQEIARWRKLAAVQKAEEQAAQAELLAQTQALTGASSSDTLGAPGGSDNGPPGEEG